MKFDISLYFLLFVVVLGVADGSSLESNESAKSNESAESPEDDRIVGGINALTKEIPWMVSLRNVVGGGHFCGGVIINAEWVLTVAHCAAGRTPSTIFIAAGSIYINSGYTSYAVKTIVSHPSYNSATGYADIAMIKTVTGMAVGTPNINALLINTLSTPDNQNVVVCGWGFTSYPGTAPNTLQKLNTLTFNNGLCKNQLASVGVTVLPVHQCTFTKAGQGECYGDSGSPVTWNSALIALVSRGIPCAKGYADMNIAVWPYISWISNTIFVNIFK